MSVQNQDIIKLAKREPWDSNNKFARMHLDALQDAMNNLKGETLKLWLYLDKNTDSYELELSQKACEEWGLKKDAYYTAKKKLIELGYLVPIRDGSNIYNFYESLSENPNEERNSENQKELSEKPKDFSEKPKNLSEKPQRNTTYTTNTTNTTIDVSFNNETLGRPQTPKPEEKETGTFENPIITSREWLIENRNQLVACNNNTFKYNDGKFYKFK